MTAQQKKIISRYVARSLGSDSDKRGAALVEFAIVANLLIALTILTYDFASYFRLSEQVKHATQFVHMTLVNDADHKLTISNLQQRLLYISAVTGDPDFGATNAMVAIDAMPLLIPASKRWSLIVCWSWSSNPTLISPPVIGSTLPSDAYPVEPWISPKAESASSALLILETYAKTPRLFDVSLLPEMTMQRSVGPVRYAASTPLNLMLYQTEGGGLINDAVTQENTGAKAILCQR